MDIIQVDIIGLQPLQTGIHGSFKKRRAVIEHGFAVFETVRTFGGDDHLTAVSGFLKHFTDQLLGALRSVDKCCIQKIDAILQGGAHDLFTCFVIQIREQVMSADRIGAESDRSDHQISSTQLFFFDHEFVHLLFIQSYSQRYLHCQ
ncbi:hypothetical protein D3C81_1789300 [compost metagenome]